ncbi:MAG: signal peptide peptidase SppA [Prevotellaceae bacterium]|jgi:protease-4|nr:signal peptide peptidase SppA [Prevotellaceae bacterium]
MKDFLKFMFATVAGLVVTGVLFFVVSLVVMAGMLSTSEPETVVQKNSVMLLNLDGELVERNQENPLRTLFSDRTASFGLDDVLSSIRKAAENDNIRGIYLQAGTLSAGYASLQEIRHALLDFKQTGKFIVAYSDNYTQSLYYLASVADKVLLNPKGVIAWQGLSSTPTFYADLLKKIGVEVQIFKVGTYKAAVEPYINTSMSDANREQIQAYAGSIWKQMVDGVAESRGLTADALHAQADRMIMMYPSEENVTCGLVDTLIYKNDVRNYLKQMMGVDKDDRINMLDLTAMTGINRNVPKDKSGNIVAVYYLTGEIDLAADYVNLSDGILSDQVIRDLRRLAEDDDVKSVVLRVNSPGGSAFGSEQIWYAVQQLKEKKPVIVSMGDYAASGGYYISCVADTIVAEPTTLTGSIGIFGMFPSFKGLADKVGLSFDVVKTNKYADFGETTRPMNEAEQALMQQTINEGYRLFVQRCADGRGMTPEAIEKIAEGRVWTGEMAVKNGLVDLLGGIDTALDIAVEKAGIDAYTVLTYPAKKSFWEVLMDSNLPSYLRSSMLTGRAAELYQPLLWLENFDKMDKIQARIPYEPNLR